MDLIDYYKDKKVIKIMNAKLSLPDNFGELTNLEEIEFIYNQLK